ncbi:hypothetical protein MMC30_000937 [Trapelia coarctata]|nr:hypothetical protein [Trapelia coarctata]
MALPTPPVPLDGHCTVIYNNTLFAYQSNAFQALQLTEGARWTQLPTGVPVNDAVCVKAMSDSQDVLFVVGGTTNSSSLQDYPGIQKYIFAERQWRTNNSTGSSVTQNRQKHSATYLNSSSSILIYGGYQDDVDQYTQSTFTISTTEPYTMRAHVSRAPPVKQPILLPWDQSHAVMMGGEPNNQAIWIFSERDGWLNLNETLPTPLPDISQVQGAIVTANDGSKVLQLFNMTASPNTVTTQFLQNGTNTSLSGRDAKPWPSSWYPTRHRRPSRKRRRDVAPNGYPAYNATLAPSTVRKGFSLAQASSGLVVISGGVSPTSDDPLCVFNQTSDRWLEASPIFNAPSTSTSNPTGSSTVSPSSTSAAGAAAPGASNHGSLTIVGAVLGAVFGFAALCIIALLLLRYLRQRRRRRGDYTPNAKGQMSYTDPGPGGGGLMNSAGGSFNSANHDPNNLPRIVAPITTTGATPPTKRGVFHKAGDSNGSSKSIFTRNRSPVLPAPQTEPGPSVTSPERQAPDLLSPEPRTAPRADEGWSTYFMENNDTTDLTQLPHGYTRYDTNSRPNTFTTTSQSDYTSDSRVVSSQPHTSAEVPPLNIRNTFSQIPEEDTDDFLEESSSGQESWTPVATSDRGSTWGDRPASSLYADTGVYPHPGNRVRIPNFPGVPTSNRTSQNTVINVNEQRGLRTLASKDFLATTEEPRQPEEGVRAGPSTEVQRSKPSPRPAGDAFGVYRGVRKDENLSWLNLGATSK